VIAISERELTYFLCCAMRVRCLLYQGQAPTYSILWRLLSQVFRVYAKSKPGLSIFCVFAEARCLLDCAKHGTHILFFFVALVCREVYLTTVYATVYYCDSGDYRFTAQVLSSYILHSNDSLRVLSRRLTPCAYKDPGLMTL